MASESPSPQLSPDRKWWWDGSKWVPAKQEPRGGVALYMRRRAVVRASGMVTRFLPLFPIGMSVFIGVVAPNYFRPLFSSLVGFGVIAGGIAAVAAGCGLNELGMRLTNKPGGWRLVAAFGLIFVGGFGLMFLALWVALLGPALVIMATGQS